MHPSIVRRMSLQGTIVYFTGKQKSWHEPPALTRDFTTRPQRYTLIMGFRTLKYWNPQNIKKWHWQDSIIWAGFWKQPVTGRERDWSRLSAFSVERELRVGNVWQWSCMERADRASSSSDLISNIKPQSSFRGGGWGGEAALSSRQTGGAGADWNIENWPDRGLTQH